MKYIYGPIPSRRLGFSLGIGPIPKKTCNYSCIYCQLGRTNPLTNTRKMFFEVKEILTELDEVLQSNLHFDVISIVGEGEPTLYYGLGQLIDEIKKRTDKPVAVITNGANLNDRQIQDELMNADLVLPSLNAYDEELFRKINRPHPQINFQDTIEGLISFSNAFKGRIWLEIMLLKGVNDDDESLEKFKEILKNINYERLYLNTVVRPPAENDIEMISPDRMQKAVDILSGISIDLLSTKSYQSLIEDDYEAIISIIKRHPMNQHEILAFLNIRGVEDSQSIIKRLDDDAKLEKLFYKGYIIYRYKV